MKPDAVSYREQVRETLRSMTDEALAHQLAHGSPGGIDREEMEWEAARRRSEVSYDCECLDGGHNTGFGICMCGGRMKSWPSEVSS